MQQGLNSKMMAATKWSAITEIMAKIVQPVSNMMLARLLVPEAFGVVAIITMIVSFADIFADAGFQKYMVQHEFEDEQEKITCANVAFWTNIVISMAIWSGIIFFRHPLAAMIGSAGLGDVIAIACISIPLVSISSLQMALFRRKFDFKTLFQIRLCYVLVPFLVTIPLAFFLRSYWALVIGTICANSCNAILLTVRSNWKPKFQFSFEKFQEMFSFSMWTLLEQISIWLTLNIDIFIVGTVLNEYYLGIYKTAMVTANGILNLVTGATTAVLFSALSRLQNNRDEFNQMFFQFQRLVSMLVLPMGVGIFIYRDFITWVLLGTQWNAAADFLGMWALAGSIAIVLSHYCSEIYRSLGKPLLSFLAQILHIIVLIPVVYWGVYQTFDLFCFSRALVRLQMVVVHAIIIWFVLRISMWDFIRNVWPALFCSILMGGFGILVNSLILAYWWNGICIIFCIVFYFTILLLLFPNLKKELLRFIRRKKNGF